MFILDGESIITIIHSVENKKVILYGSGHIAKEVIIN